MYVEVIIDDGRIMYVTSFRSTEHTNRDVGAFTVELKRSYQYDSISGALYGFICALCNTYGFLHKIKSVTIKHESGVQPIDIQRITHIEKKCKLLMEELRVHQIAELIDKLYDFGDNNRIKQIISVDVTKSIAAREDRASFFEEISSITSMTLAMYDRTIKVLSDTIDPVLIKLEYGIDIRVIPLYGLSH